MAEVLEAVEASLDTITLFISGSVMRDSNFAGSVRGDHGFDTNFYDDGATLPHFASLNSYRFTPIHSLRLVAESYESALTSLGNPQCRSDLRAICDAMPVMDTVASPLPHDVEALTALLSAALERAYDAEACLADAKARKSSTEAMIARLMLQITKLNLRATVAAEATMH